MKTKDIKNVAAAWAEVQESQKAALAKKLAKASASSEKGKAAVTLPKAPFKIPSKNEANEAMDPVDKKELKGKHSDRKDKDIDNDGDVDASDKFLHKRRKAISKSTKKDKEVVDTKPEIKDNSKDTEMSEKQESRRPIFDRIMEKAGSREDHVKGATDPEAIDSKASQGEKDFVAKHGGLGGNDSGIDGAKAAAYTIKNAAAAVKVGPGRTNDNKSGDKKPIKSTEA
jgi:hypothetical protein